MNILGSAPPHLPTSQGPTTSSAGLSGGRLDRICSRPSTWSACLCDSQMQQRPETYIQVPGQRREISSLAKGDSERNIAEYTLLTTAAAPARPELLTRPPQVPSPQSTIMKAPRGRWRRMALGPLQSAKQKEEYCRRGGGSNPRSKGAWNSPGPSPVL